MGQCISLKGLTTIARILILCWAAECTTNVTRILYFLFLGPQPAFESPHLTPGPTPKIMNVRKPLSDQHHQPALVQCASLIDFRRDTRT